MNNNDYTSHGKKRKVSINPLFDYQTNKQVSSPASSERSNSNDYTDSSPSVLNYLNGGNILGNNNNNSNPTTPINSSSLPHDYNNHLNSGRNHSNSNNNNQDEEEEKEITNATKNVGLNLKVKSNSNLNSSSLISTSNLYSPLNYLSIKSAAIISSPPTSSTSSSSNNNNNYSKQFNSSSNMMDQLHSPYLHQDIYPPSTSSNLSPSPFLTHSSTPTSPTSLYSNSQQQQQSIINQPQQQQQQGLNLNQLHSPLQHPQSGGSSYYSPDISPSAGAGLGTSQDAGFLHQLAQLSNSNNSLPPNNGGGGGGAGSPFGMMDVGMTGILNGGNGMEMKGKGRETLDHNGQIVREVATRRGEDLGIGLGDFDMLDTLGTGTFGKVLLARLHPPSNPFSIRSQQIQPQFYAVKVLEKLTVVRLRQVEHLNSERSTLAHVSHPFIVNLLCTFQDERNLYLLLEYVQGGELFSHLRRAGRFSSDVARFYAANLILALEYLHSQDIIYRDLKPENLLIDGSGYIKITDFGFAKHVTDRTYTLCGTPEYLAPEIITATGHGKAADFWAFGVLLFELLAGYPPFFADNPLEIYEKILTGKFGFPPHIDYVAKDLIKRLLTADLSMRLGNLKNGAMDVKNHRWFEGVDWSAVERKEIRAPIIPQTSTPGDTSNFERYPASPLEDLPGPLRAHRARQYQISPDSLERGQDPYGYLFPCF